MYPRYTRRTPFTLPDAAALIDRFKLDSNAARHPRFAKLIEARRR